MNTGLLILAKSFPQDATTLQVLGGGTNGGHLEIGDLVTVEYDAAFIHDERSSVSSAGAIQLDVGTHVYAGEVELLGSMGVRPAATLVLDGTLRIGGPPTSAGGAGVFFQGKQTLLGTGEIEFIVVTLCPATG